MPAEQNKATSEMCLKGKTIHAQRVKLNDQAQTVQLQMEE